MRCIKVIFVCILFLSTLLSSIGCTESTQLSQEDVNIDKEDGPNLESEKVSTITINDFTLTDKNQTFKLSLGDVYSDNMIPFKEVERNYVGEVYEGKYSYKYYLHIFENIDIYTSNYKYNIKGEDFDKYYVSQIVITDPSIITARGVNIGITESEVLRLYGEPIGEKQNLLEYELEYEDLKYILTFKSEGSLIDEIILKIN